MRIVKLTKDTMKDIQDSMLKRSPNNFKEQEGTVNEILSNIRENGDKALFDYTLRFDKAEINAENIKVTKE